MSSKKHKHKPKQNKSNPSLKSEVTETQIQEPEPLRKEEKEKLETIKSEEPIPTVSKTVTSLLEDKVSEEDIPKKPKRNRGKKKKTDKDEEFDDNVENQASETIVEDIKIPVLVPEAKTIDASQEKTAELSALTPAARKKKNKNKKQSEPTEAAEEIKIAPITKEELADVKIITCMPVATEADESKSKKKNKKKKRTDSEKSDKAEEAITCTAAFQKLLEGSDKKDVITEIPAEQIKSDVSSEIKKELTKDTGFEKDISKSEDDTKDVQNDESGKGKKKNKKDKKPLAKTEDDIVEPIDIIKETTEKQPAIELIDIPSGSATIKKDIDKSNLETPESVLKQKSPKLKAKIAKPVEKKGKVIDDGSSADKNTEKASETSAVEEKKISTSESSFEITAAKPLLEAAVSKLTEIEKSADKAEEDTSDTKIEHKEEVKLPKLPDVKEKQTSADTGTGKKGKKGKQKPAETTEIKTEPKTEVVTKIEAKNEETPVIRTVTSLPKQGEIFEIKTQGTETKGSLEQMKDTFKINDPEPLSFAALTPTESKVLATPDIGKTPEYIAPIETEIPKTDLQLPETSSHKKRKKSPKRPQEEETKTKTISEKAATPSLGAISKTETEHKEVQKNILTESPKETFEVMKESITELPLLEDIEIKSVKTEESEGSACDIVPDIHYPRASSQLLDDNNNTTVIRDVTAIDVKLNIPPVALNTPLIQGSGETPSICPELIPRGITFTEIEPDEPKKQDNVKQPGECSMLIKTKLTEDVRPKLEEKTDLKSKVLDVNQGMVELRKSIERSLAELSAIERNEKDAEEQFAKAQSKLEEIQDIASKRSEDKKDKAKIENIIEIKDKTPVQTAITEAHKTQVPTKSESCLVKSENLSEPIKPIETLQDTNTNTQSKLGSKEITLETIKSAQSAIPLPPPLPARRDNKGKGKKKKGKQDSEQGSPSTATISTTECSSSTTETKESGEKTEKTKQKTEKTDNQEKGKQQSDALENNNLNDESNKMEDSTPTEFNPIDNFEDAMTSSLDDINKTFEMIADEANQIDVSQNPKINITAPVEDDDKRDTKDDKREKVNPVSQPKNLLGHPDIPARLNKTDYKKEKDKSPNLRQAKVKIKDSVPIEVTKASKESQTEHKSRFLKNKTTAESISSVTNDSDEYIYKYSFRKVFLSSACHVCKKDLKQLRVPCSFCNLIFYCSPKHKDEDYPYHQALCFAVSTIGHLKDQKHIFADVKNITGQEYRLLRMQVIVSCEKVLKRRLTPWEQEALLYPRLCADEACREWRQSNLVDCEGCGQIAYCATHPEHLPKSHQRWCKSYSLYHRLVVYQETKGRLQPKMPTRVMSELYQMPEKLNEVLASMYEEKIDMTDIQYASLTRIATAPLTAAFCQQLFTSKMNGIYANGTHKKSSFTIHVIGVELQFEADALNKWEYFFLHLRPDVKDLRVVLVGPDLNPSKLPLDLLGKIKLCDTCRQNKRRVVFEFQDNKTYYDYWSSDFSSPDLVCAFNPSIQKCAAFNGKDTWPSTIKCIMKLRVPFIITSYTMNELNRDLARIKICSDNDVQIISEPRYNAFASVRPDRNFISDDEMPLLFKNYCFSVVCGSI